MISAPMTDAASKDPVPFSKPSYDERELEAVRRALAVQTTGDGPAGRRVEAQLAALLGAPRVLLTTSGSHALELALLALGIERGQEVVLPSFTFVSCANAILRVGARPVFADIEERTLGLDPQDVERRLTPRTAALLPVDYAGVAPDMAALVEIAGARRLRVVEDAAQGIAAAWRGKALGTLGDAGCLSFHETKNVSCGEGGALVVHDPELALRAEIAREKGTNRSAFLRGQVDKYTWVSEGSSYVLSDVLAAILEAQLDKLEAIQAHRAEVVARYRDGLASWAAARGVRLAQPLPERVENHHIFYLLYPDGRLRDAALAALRERGVMATFHYVPLHSSPFGRTLGEQPALPVTDRIASTLLRLPLHARLREEDVERVIGAVLETET
ncbi:MAG: dTDP-4-amino-4,6-dideoxygalactose transaminase [Betaproteobacteria bacterium]